MNVIYELRAWAATGVEDGIGETLAGDLRLAADRLELYERVTGGLPPELVAKALAALGQSPESLMSLGVMVRGGLEPEEVQAIRAATFEVPT